MLSQPGTDDGLVAICASFGIGAALGPGAEGQALTAAGMPRRRPRRPVYPFSFPPQMVTGTAVGSFTAPGTDQSGPGTGWFWDVTSLSVTGFTAGAVAVTKNSPAITAAGAVSAIEVVAQFAAAGTQNFPQKGTPLLDGNDYLVFTVTGAITGVVNISGSVIMVPAERIDEYLS
jgi:hypothetical protein